MIRENIRKGFLDTQSKVNSWVTNLKKRIDGDEVDQQSGPSQGESAAYSRPRRSGDMGRRSGDRERYDADPQVLGDDFSALELRDGEGKQWFSLGLLNSANISQLLRASLPVLAPTSRPPLLRQTGARCPSRMDLPLRLIPFIMLPRPPSATARRATSLANGSPCPPSSLPPLQRTIHSVSVTAMMRRILRPRSNPLSRKVTKSRRPRPRPCPMKWVPPRTRIRRTPASPMRRNKRECLPFLWISAI